jgi:hypothetical protein
MILDKEYKITLPVVRKMKKAQWEITIFFNDVDGFAYLLVYGVM